MRRGDVWWAELGRKRRPVLVLTRTDVIDVRELVTVAEITTQARGLAVEVPLDPEAGVDQGSVVNADGIHTIRQRMLTRQAGSVGDETLASVCRAVSVALDC